jgi:alkylated DNA repair dioxygenase AlkB
MATLHLADDGIVQFIEQFYAPADARSLFEEFRSTIPWQQEHGRTRHPFPRLTAWYADPGVSYHYSGVTHHPQPWTPLLLPIKQRVEAAANHSFNSLLLNYYRTGQDSIGMHADDEPELGTNPMIGSLSFGAARHFILKHNQTGAKHTIDLTDGSLLIMAGTCQHFWKHGIPKTKADVGPRINLTFRHTYPRPSLMAPLTSHA